MFFLQVIKRLLSINTQKAASLTVATLLVSACATSLDPAPVSDRTKPASVTMPAGSSATNGSTPASNGFIGPFADKAGQPGFYTVKRGDTLMRISTENGQDWRDVAKWSGLDNANVIEVNQVLRVALPVGTVIGRPLAAASAPKAPASAPGAPASAPSTGTPGADDEDLVWSWPAAGPVVGSFDDVKNKGLDIGGKAGDPIFAAADGRVVYAGGAIRGYGNLVIVKHNTTFITAYAHNQTILVKEAQVVKRGQKIAEMGSSDADRVKLHFEIRKSEKPVDPLKWLPSK